MHRHSFALRRVAGDADILKYLDTRVLFFETHTSIGAACCKIGTTLIIMVEASHQVRNKSLLGRYIPYFRNEENVLRAKLDGFLLLWMFIAGIMKEMDQSATTQAYVSGMKEDLNLYGDELNWFQTYFSIAYAIFLVPSQMLQTKLRPSLWLPFAEIAWGIVTLL